MPTVASPGIGSAAAAGSTSSSTSTTNTPSPRSLQTVSMPLGGTVGGTASTSTGASPLHQKIHVLEETLKRFKIFDRTRTLSVGEAPPSPQPPPVSAAPPRLPQQQQQRQRPAPPVSLAAFPPVSSRGLLLSNGGEGSGGSSAASSCSSTTSSGCRTSPMPRRVMILDVGGHNGGGTALSPPSAFTSQQQRRYIPRRRPHEWHNGLVACSEQPSKRYSDSAEVQRRLEEIMKQTGIMRIDGKEYKAEPRDMEFLGELGHGTCGQVVKMRFRQTGTLMAVKQMRRSGNKEENKRVIMDLDVVLKSHDCPYIVKCFGCFITDCDVWVCMELMATCLEKLAKRIKAPIPEPIIGKMAVALLKALDYLKEKQGIIHRDVKPSNMLLDWNGTVKLCDFGISGRLVDSKAKTRTGCAAYMAPERIDPPDPSSPDYDIRADVWSLGISLVELARGSFPYEGCSTDFEVMARILGDEPPRLPPDDITTAATTTTTAARFSADFRDFVNDCLVKNHLHRPKYKQLMEHRFISHYEAKEVDVAGWFRSVMAHTASPSPSPDANYNYPPPPPLPPKPKHTPSPSGR